MSCCSFLQVFCWRLGSTGLAASLVRYAPLSRGWALSVVCAVFWRVLLSVVVWSVVPQVLGQLDDLWEPDDGVCRATARDARKERVGKQPGEREPGPGSDGRCRGRLPCGKAAWAGLAVIGALGSAIVLLAIALFGAARPSLYCNVFLALLPAAQRPKLAGALEETARALRWWFLGQLVSMATAGR